MRSFISVLLVVLALVWFYTWHSFIQNSGYSEIVMGLFAGVWLSSYALQVWRWISYQKSDESPKKLLAAYFFLGLMSHIFVFAILKDIVVSLSAVAWDSVWLMDQAGTVNAVVLFVCVLFNLYGVRTALRGPCIQTVAVKAPQLQRNLRIVQISDLHVGPIIRKDYVENVVKKTLELNPDLIFITGDLGDGQVESLDESLEPLRRLGKAAPTYYVTGNHEGYWGLEGWVNKVRELGFQALNNEGLVPFQGVSLFLGGVTDHGPNPTESLRTCPSEPAHYKLLLAHQPKVCFTAETAGYDLMMCGHTHEGQFFPFNLVVGYFNPYVKGLNQHKRMKVYVNTGTGFWGAPLRLGTRSEITLLNLEGVST